MGIENNHFCANRFGATDHGKLIDCRELNAFEYLYVN